MIANQEMSNMYDQYQGKLAAISGLGTSQQYAAENAINKETAAQSLWRSIKLLQEAAHFTENVSLRLCGAWPQDPVASTKETDPDGLFPQLGVTAERIEAMARQIIENMNRIQRMAG